jgi:hypothetical protein
MLKRNSIYLIGAGFSKAINDQMPLNNNLAKKLIECGCETVKKYASKSNSNDIEKILTYFDLDSAKDNLEKAKERQAINDKIASYFKDFRFKETDTIPPWLKILALEVFKKNDAIISLNYDCLLEGVLDYLDVWSPYGGYARIENPLLNNKLKNQRNIKIFKIHGSENFVESEVKNELKQTGISLTVDSSTYPKSCAHCRYKAGLNSQPYVIAPSFVKVPHVDITAMMIDLLTVTKEANNLVIIGCGMRPEDNYLWLLLTIFLNKNAKNGLKLIIVDPIADKIWAQISSYWVGNICEYTSVSIIPCGVEEGMPKLKSIMASS